METEIDSRPASTCAVKVTPNEIDVGATMALSGEAACSPPRDLRGQALLIEDAEGNPAARLHFEEFDGEVSRTAEVAVEAPPELGDYTWRAVISNEPQEAEGAATFSFTVRAHGIRILVWDVPSTVAAGERFRMRVGAKCSSGCAPTGWTFEIQDHLGATRARAELEDAPWPGTTALFSAEVELDAPESEGLHTWVAVLLPAAGKHPHDEGRTTFRVRSVAPPEILLRVEAIDRDSRRPVERAKVVVHPYRTFTDADGVAELRIPKGEYRLFVSGKRYVPYRQLGAVTEDTTVRTELYADVGLSDADVWA